MALSENERRVLAEMEEALSVDDPALVGALTGTRLYPGRSRLLVSVAIIVGGIATLFAGLISKQTVIGILGFLIALGGVIMAIGAISALIGALRGGGPKAAKAKGSTWASRMESRWDRRNFDN
jgi:hypothetical protein